MTLACFSWAQVQVCGGQLPRLQIMVRLHGARHQMQLLLGEIRKKPLKLLGGGTPPPTLENLVRPSVKVIQKIQC